MEKIKVIDMCVDDFGQFGVHAISLVEKPAIQIDFIALNENKQRFVQLESQEKRMLYGAILIPDQLIYRIDEETGEPYYIRYSPDTVEKIAYNYMKNQNQRKWTFEHQMPIDDVTMVETWLVSAKNDKSQALGFNLKEKTWFGGIKVDNDSVWEDAKNGIIRGISIEGYFLPAKEQMLSEAEKLLKELDEIIKG